MSKKKKREMVVMDERVLEAQGVAALGAPCKMLKTFEVVHKKMGTNDPTVLSTHRSPRWPRLWLAMAADCQNKSAWKYKDTIYLFLF